MRVMTGFLNALPICLLFWWAIFKVLGVW